MTAQISDGIIYREKPFCLAGRKGPPLFDPSKYGLHPVGSCSACWRGFMCEFEIANSFLFLRKAHMCFFTDAPPLWNVEAESLASGENDFRIFSHMYSFENQIIPFTGGLLLADGFIEELYVHMGFHPAWKYEEVHEIKFENGRVVFERDCSEAMAKIRSRNMDRPLEPGAMEKIPAWIEKCFSEEYDEFE
jgi:hypothetical protein